MGMKNDKLSDRMRKWRYENPNFPEPFVIGNDAYGFATLLDDVIILEHKSTAKNNKMRKAIQDAIEESNIDWECSGIQTEHVNTLVLEKWSLDDPDAVVNEILGIVSDYISEVL